MKYLVKADTFDMGGIKDKALKLLEEASEAREAAQRWANGCNTDDMAGSIKRERVRKHAVYECCDTLQATFNLLAALGVTQEELDATMAEVRQRNAVRGRYGTTGPAR